MANKIKQAARHTMSYQDHIDKHLKNGKIDKKDLDSVKMSGKVKVKKQETIWTKGTFKLNKNGKPKRPSDGPPKRARWYSWLTN